MEAFDSLPASPVAEYQKIRKEIGGDVQKEAEMVRTGLNLEWTLLVIASKCQQQTGNQLSDLLAPISEQIQEVITFPEKNQGSKLFNYLSSCPREYPSPGLGGIAPKPVP